MLEFHQIGMRFVLTTSKVDDSDILKKIWKRYASFFTQSQCIS